MGFNSYKYGIVFCGGGAKGAYQIGVWKRLKELGLDKEIIGVSGASIGAMNSMLFAQGDYTSAEEAWSQVRNEDMKALNLPLIKAALKSLLPYAAASGVIAPALTALLWNPMSYVSLAAVTPIVAPVVAVGAATSVGLGIKEIIPQLGLFTKEGLNAIIQSTVDPLGIATTDKQVYTALTALTGARLPDKAIHDTDAAFPILKPFGQIEYRSWENLSYDEIVETVLASAAMPGAYPASAHKGKIYLDGGVLDNTPVKPLIEAGFSYIIVVHLEYLETKKQRKKEQQISSQANGQVKFFHVWPSNKSIGDTLQISPYWTKMRINLGYIDAQSQLIPQLEKIKNTEQAQLAESLKRTKKLDAEKHYDLANEIYKQFIRNAVQHKDIEKVRAFLQTEKGRAMLSNYEYAAETGHESAKQMTDQLHRLLERD